VALITDRETGQWRGFGFVENATPEAVHAMQNRNNLHGDPSSKNSCVASAFGTQRSIDSFAPELVR
jgi:hypothetical protein